MTPQQLSRIREIYEAAIELPSADRPIYVARESAGDELVKREVERMLDAREHVPGWLEQPLLAAARSVWGVAMMQGRQLSGYTIAREIAHGGMGTVYLAERSDGAFHRLAAIKIVLPSPNIVSRFQQEREILASLDHPNIARLLDGGVTEEGWPYFVMEYVDGQPIDRWCDERKLNITQRLELFRSVIDAVRYAHQRLVVHRDLKPGNIFVTNDGTVKLLDFGIAKLLSPPGSGEPAETQTLARMMTPEYASPEQVNGTTITTLSDIYSLGVTLYELLTGHRPYRVVSAAMHEMSRVIAEVEPTRPSEIVTREPGSVSAVREGDAARLSKRLAGDLDSILLMALQKDPERRYSSVESLSDDLQRHLEHRPIAARRAGAWYRITRFCRRNPGLVLAGGLLVSLIVVGMASVVWQARHMVDTARSSGGGSPFLGPVWLFFVGVAAIIICITSYFSQPTRATFAGALAGGAVWAVGSISRWWAEGKLGWWRSRFSNDPDPFMFFSGLTAFVYLTVGVAFLLILYVFGRRFGWKYQALAVVAIALGQEVRERVWFSTIIPALTFEWGALPVFGGAAMLSVYTFLGLAVMRLIANPTRKES